MKIENRIHKCSICGKEYTGNNIGEFFPSAYQRDTPCPECLKKEEADRLLISQKY
ncbi:MAG: hypothetical protein WC455_20690 [Dehalococcoidia bacterium]|jgi:DNA-directed RNA polymerase subunit RPC12/RpoP